METGRFHRSQSCDQRVHYFGTQVCWDATPVPARRLTIYHSDGVLNPSGVRFGSGEIYTVMEQFSGPVNEALCVGQRRPQDKDERVLLFLKMRAGYKFTPQLETEIRTAIRKGLSARHVPAYIFEVSDIPVSRSGAPVKSDFWLNISACSIR